MKANRVEARATDLNFLPPTSHATGLTASILWTFSLTGLDPGRRGDDMDGVLRLIIGAVVTIRGVFRSSWTGEDEGGGQDVSKRVKKGWRDGEGTD